MRLRSKDHFQTIHTEGGLLPADLLQRVADGDRHLDGLGKTTYHLAPNERLNERITGSWNRLRAAWSSFSAEREKLAASETGARITREHWQHVLFDELGYGRLVQERGVQLGDKLYPVFAHWQHSPLHFVGCNTPLDRRSSGVQGAATQSPHSLVQELLNRSDERLWGFVTNGLVLRVLRDNVTLTRQAYVEFDLEAMLDSEAYADFAVLWLVCHQSRIEGETPAECWLEKWTQAAAQEGTRALETLRDGVEAAVQILGSGFLRRRGNSELHAALRDGELTSEDYYRSLLRLVYRLLFLFVAEDRDVLLVGDDRTARERYASHYSTMRLRRLAGRRRGGLHPDLYEQLKVVMTDLHESGRPALALPALGSSLWDPTSIHGLQSATLANEDLLDALRVLAYVEEGQVLRAVDFRNLGAEELGSVYESLLELHPDVDREQAVFDLRHAAGGERKKTGSYYTQASLIDVLLDASLTPLLDEASAADEPEEALLNLTVCDPACGSGHFLVAAARRIARRLAAVRTGDPEPSPSAVQHALRDVVGRCIFGVDINPLAVELCKVALWMETLDPGRPLSFLDGHIRPGNALLGALPGLVEDGVPDSAFQALRGDEFGQLQPEDKPFVTRLRDKNAAERRGVMTLFDPEEAVGELAAGAELIAKMVDDDLASVSDKEREFNELRSSETFRRLHVAADAWTAAAVAEKGRDRPAITHESILAALNDSLAADVAAAIQRLRQDYRFFHWHLEFPDVFAHGGFHLVLGNPPWKTLSPDLKEFFAPYDPEIRFVNKDDQREIVTALLDDEAIAREWRHYCRALYASVHAFKNGGRYRLFAPGNLGKGDFDIYRMFAETALATTREGGYAAQVLKEGLSNGANAAAIRAELFEHFEVSRLMTFANTGGIWFRDIHVETKFCIYAARRGAVTTSFPAAFQIDSLPALATAIAEPLDIPVSLVREFSPDALAVMRFASRAEIDAVKKAYAACPKFGDRSRGQPYRTYMREIDMGTDRDLFGDYEDGVPLYEARMVTQYDHRAKGYRSGRGRAALWDELGFDRQDKTIQPQWRLPTANVPAKARERITKYRVGFCDVTSPTTDRSLLAALIPPGVICGHTLPTFTYPDGYEWAYAAWLAVANSFAVDAIARKKVSLHMSLGIVDSLPIPRFADDDEVVRRLVPLAARLTCTSPEMDTYWRVLAQNGWVQGAHASAAVRDEDRLAIRAEIDVIVARDVFGLSAEEMDSILSTFNLAERYEVEKYGEFRSRRLILEGLQAAPEDAAAA